MALKIGTLEVDIGADTSDLVAAEAEVARSGKKMASSTDAATKRISKSFVGPTRAAGTYAKAANSATGAMKNMGHVSRQLGFQIQDVAVQLQMGTNAMTILSQQGSQVASVFGPGGAVIGAFIAVVGAIGGALLPSVWFRSW